VTPADPAPARAAAAAAPKWRAFLTLPRTVGWRDHVIGGAIAVVYLAWLLATVRSLGFARDEGTYFRAAMSYSRWFKLLGEHPHDAFQEGAIDGTWGDNHEHPPLMKSLFSFSWMLFHEKWHVFTDASTAFRFPGMVMMGIALWVTYLFGARVYSRRAGAIAAVLLGLMPRIFYNAHLACFDVGILAMWTWCIYVYWRAQQAGGIRWALAAGVLYGLTLATKHNAWILPAVFLPHALFVHRRVLLRLPGVRLRFPFALPAMALLGPPVFFALWPWIWNDTVDRLREYAEFHLNHVYYNMEFLHVNYFNAPSPRGYMPVMILATVPAITLVLFASGLVLRGRIHLQRLRAWLHPATVEAPAEVDPIETDLLFFLAFAAALGPWILPKTPIFGGTKHWITAYPFFCLFAGYAFDRAAKALRAALCALPRLAADPRLCRTVNLGAQVALVASVVAGPFAVTEHSHPFGLSSYTPLVGGTAGGATLGLNRQFWGFTTESLEPYFEARAPRGASVYFNDTSWDAWGRMIDEKRIRPDLRGAGSPSDAEIAIVHIERHMMEVDYSERMVFGTTAPDYVLTHDGVPIIDVYRRKR
jgi:4-amino-4-deoxy-L-arabinose transferase-like glycosyltransferase